MNRIALFLALILPACSLLEPQSPEGSEAPMGQYESKFPSLEWNAGDTISLPAFRFGRAPREMGFDSSKLIPSEKLGSIFPEKLLEQADYDSSAMHYPLGAIPFGEGKRAYMIGVYNDFHTFHTQLFLFDSLEERFTYTQSLAYLIGGGGFLSLRKAWMVDINSDSQPDLVYRKDELYNAPGEPEHSYFLDTLRAEVWDGFRFQTTSLKDAVRLKEIFAMDD